MRAHGLHAPITLLDRHQCRAAWSRPREGPDRPRV